MNTFSFQLGNLWCAHSKGCKDFKAAEQQRNKHESAPAYARPRFVYQFIIFPECHSHLIHNSPKAAPSLRPQRHRVFAHSGTISSPTEAPFRTPFDFFFPLFFEFKKGCNPFIYDCAMSLPSPVISSFSSTFLSSFLQVKERLYFPSIFSIFRHSYGIELSVNFHSIRVLILTSPIYVPACWPFSPPSFPPSNAMLIF
jgi:hypothetical protein